MSETAKKLFTELRAAMHHIQSVAADGVSQSAGELSRLGTQGASELASALFSQSNAFVQYGPGQNRPSESHEHDQHQQQQMEIER